MAKADYSNQQSPGATAANFLERKRLHGMTSKENNNNTPLVRYAALNQRKPRTHCTPSIRVSGTGS